jgi:hypothetical protein
MSNMDFTKATMDDVCDSIDLLTVFFKEHPHCHALMQMDLIATSIVYPNDALLLANGKSFDFVPPPHKRKKLGRKPVQFSYSQISVLFGMPIMHAADILDVAESTLKRNCRRLGITFWPYRFERSLLDIWSSV